MAKNENFHKARHAKNDEFYTQLADIEKELGHYTKHFKGKSVFLNCDDPEESNFWKYFKLNFDFLGLKHLVATHFAADKQSYKLELVRDIDGKGSITQIQTTLKENGDFRSPECIELLKQADIVVTNPPFSLFREYIAQLVEYKKKFLVIGNMNAITYKDIFNLIQNNKVWLGISNPKTFVTSDGGIQNFGNICWFTNLKHRKRTEELILYKEYNKKEYPKFDHLDVINVNKVKDIPCDYFKIMGVPITFLGSHNPDQFEILGFKNGGNKDATINGKHIYDRIHIRRVKQ